MGKNNTEIKINHLYILILIRQLTRLILLLIIISSIMSLKLFVFLSEQVYEKDLTIRLQNLARFNMVE